MAVQAREAFGPVQVRVQKRRTVRRTAWKRRPPARGTTVPSSRWTARGGDRLAVQLAVCGGAFVLLVTAKLLLPDGTAALRQSLSGAMERNVDVQAVFSAVGRAVSGEENSAEEVWSAVFSPIEPGVFQGAAASDRADMPDGTQSPDSGNISNGIDELNGAQSPESIQTVQSAGLTAGEAIPDRTAYSVPPGRVGQAWDVLRQYRSGSVGTGRTQNTEPPQTREPPDETVDGGTDNGSADNSGTDGSSAGNSGADGNSAGNSGADGRTENGSGIGSPGEGMQTRSDSPILPERVSMEQVILNFNYRTPVFGTLTSGFGLRTDPIQGREKFHHGVDLAAPSGTDILCFADGTVSAVGESTSYGKYCIVDHAGGCSTLYAHCSRITASSGEAVAMGEKIGEVGSTGAATGPHLHFELHKGGAYLNPIYYVSHN